MQITIDLARLRRTKLREYALRFLFGGLTTVVAGMIAHRYGPTTGGLFLAFPAIFPSSATLVEKHEIQKKERAGLHGHNRGREAVALDAIGAALGSLGLIGFGLVIWLMLVRYQPMIVLSAALMVWLIVAMAAWTARRVI